MRNLFRSKPWFNHAFEVLCGRGCNRIYLKPKLLEPNGKWRLDMYGRFDAYADTVARMWKSLNEQGIPTYLHNADDLRKLLLGDDWILIAPRYVYSDYMSTTTQFGRKIGLALHLWEEYEDQLIPRVEWMPLELPVIDN